MNRFALVPLVLSLTLAMAASGQTPVRFLKSRLVNSSIPQALVIDAVKKNLDLNSYREAKVQAIADGRGNVAHFVVHLSSKTHHRVDFAKISANSKMDSFTIEKNYTLTKEDLVQQPGGFADDATCPDNSVQFISLCPNDDEFEIGIAKEVAVAAKAKNLKVVELYKEAATRQAWLNYMSCPNLIGNFYDGDANTSVIAVADGVVHADDFAKVLKGKWNYKVTNVWLACQAYNDPMLTAVQKDDESRKYAAGINDLLVGPSDKAAACTMKAALEGKAMTPAFNECYKQFDKEEDKWGFGGDGTDYLFN